MAQSKRHVYSRVSGPDLGWPWEGFWGRPGCLWTVLWGLGDNAGARPGPLAALMGLDRIGIPSQSRALCGYWEALTFDSSWTSGQGFLGGWTVLGISDGVGGLDWPFGEAFL